jgi:hypothetical protein
MPRLVIPLSVAKGRFAALSVSNLPPDTYRDRLIKYIPAESVTLYTLADKALTAYYGLDPAGTTTRPADNLLAGLSWGLVLLGTVGTPIYLFRQRIGTQPWKMHAAVSTVAFISWAYTLGGSVFVMSHVYNVLLAGLAAPIFTYVSGWFEPKSP